MTNKQFIKVCIIENEKEFDQAIAMKGLTNYSRIISDDINQYKSVLKDLEILEKLKKPMLYSERKKLGEEYIAWCKENNVKQDDLTNVMTWCFCFKMKEWLNNDNR